LTARAAKRYRLELNAPAFAMVAKRLDPSARRLGVTDPGTTANIESEPFVGHPTAAVAHGNFGPRALLGLEIAPPASGWPPLSSEWEWLDLGFVDTRGERQSAIERLNSALPPPDEVVIVCSLAATPDRGSERFLSSVAVGHGVAMLLSEGERLRCSGARDSVERRVADWRLLAQRIGVPGERVLEVDLDNLTDNSARRLSRFLGSNPRKAAQGNADGALVAEAFARILDRARGWNAAPNALEQAELHREISRIYRGRGDVWKTLLGATGEPGNNPAAMLELGASRMMEILPERLRKNRNWIATGAVAGAMACVAAATFAAPVALAALPVWAGLGGALSWVAKERLDASAGKQRPVASEANLGDAVSAATLFTVLLELQGLDERDITRMFDEVFDVELPELRSVSEIESWLQSVRERLMAARTRQ
jgi:hypothetical protein